jgi:hypothetical protein
MIKTGLCFILVIFGTGAFAQIHVEKNDYEKYLCLTLSGHRSLFGDNSKYYKVLYDSLYVFKKQYKYIPYDSSKEQKESIRAVRLPPIIIESYQIDKDDLLALDSLFEKTDSFGSHIVRLVSPMSMQRPRFYLEGRYKGKKMSGFTIDCYRRNIYNFVDWLNKVYPKGDIIKYDKQELILREQEIKLNHEKAFEEGKWKIYIKKER